MSKLKLLIVICCISPRISWGNAIPKTEIKEKNISLETNLCGYTLKNPFILASGACKNIINSLFKAVNQRF